MSPTATTATSPSAVAATEAPWRHEQAAQRNAMQRDIAASPGDRHAADALARPTIPAPCLPPGTT